MNWIYLFIPLVTGYLTSYKCHIGKSSGKTVKARPPPWVFGIVWPVLYLLLGYSWVLLRKKDKSVDALFWMNIIGLVNWLIVYGCMKDKKSAVFILLGTFIIALVTWGYAIKSTVKGPMYYLAPYVGWLLFALLLNFTEVNKN